MPGYSGRQQADGGDAMIESIRVDGFRGLDEVDVDALGQFNLIVGPGNVGKTNLLEALFLFCSNGDASLIPKTLELRRVQTADRSPKELVALIDWFWSVGRERPSFEIEGSWQGKKRLVRVSKVDRKAEIAIRSPENEMNEEDLRDALAVYELETVTDDTTLPGKLYVTRKA